MKEFLDAFASLLTGFPPVLLNILTSGAGAVVTVIIAARAANTPPAALDLLGQFVLCWLTGGILGPSIAAPLVQSLLKLPDYAVCFLTAGSGVWIWEKFIPKKRDTLLNQTDSTTQQTDKDDADNN